MILLHWIQYYVYSICILLFTAYSYVVYFSDVISVLLREDLSAEYDYIIVSQRERLQCVPGLLLRTVTNDRQLFDDGLGVIVCHLIGSGTAGSLVAHRLSTETDQSFLVLEAGSRGQALMDMPIVGPVLHGSLFDWHFQTEPQEYGCHASKDNKCRLPQGKLLGGSSKVNNMVHFRGNISHYVKWFHSKHSETFLRKHFQFVENNILHFNRAQYETEFTNAVLEAAQELGYNEIGIDAKIGFSRSLLSQKNGKRCSTSDNLKKEHVVTNALVERVLIKDGIAHGILVNILGRHKILRARKGVILSAGTLNSPKILQLSGVGPAELLKSLKIPLIKDLPVGRNLQDHVTAGLDLVMFDTPLSISGADIVNPINTLNYLLFGTGPLTTAGCEVVGFLSTKNESEPDLQFMVLPTGIATDRGSRLRKSLGIKDNIWDEYFTKSFDKHTASILPIVLHPKSKGELYIQSRDPNIPPIIDPRYLSHEDDRLVLLKGLKLVHQFVETKAMKKISAHLNPNHIPGCENYSIFSDEYWKCYIRVLSLPSYHPVGTCCMGLPGDKNSVVDTSFKVIGVKRLYVVDGSVLPSIPGGNINAAIAMMANVFFDTSIKKINIRNVQPLFCFKNDLLNEYLFNVCVNM